MPHCESSLSSLSFSLPHEPCSILTLPVNRSLQGLAQFLPPVQFHSKSATLHAQQDTKSLTAAALFNVSLTIPVVFVYNHVVVARGKVSLLSENKELKEYVES